MLRTNSTFASLCDILERIYCELLMFIYSLHRLASCPWIWNCSEMLCLRDIFNGAIESVDCTVGEYVFISHIFKSDFQKKKKVIFLPRRRVQIPILPPQWVQIQWGAREPHNITTKEGNLVQNTWRKIRFLVMKTILVNLTSEQLWDSTLNYPTLTVSALSKHTRVDQSRTRRARNTQKKVSRTWTMKEREREITRCTRKHLLNTIPHGLTNF